MGKLTDFSKEFFELIDEIDAHKEVTIMKLKTLIDDRNKLILENAKNQPDFSQSPTVQDCPCAIPICQPIYNEVNAYSGQGNLFPEINSIISCLGQGEKNDVWYIFVAQTSGLVNFSITPNVNSDD